MQPKGPAYIFPAFTTEHPFDQFHGHKGLKDHFHKMLDQGNRHIQELSSQGIRHLPDLMLKDELASQVMTYIFSCTLSDLFRKSGVKPSYSAGYSMGLYAALYHAGSISYTTGLEIVLSAYEEISKITGDTPYGMASVIGLEEQDITALIRKKNLSLEITNRNNPVAYLVSGLFSELKAFILLAREEGALHFHIMNVSVPYHSRVLRKIENSFRDFVNSLDIRKPEVRIISLIDQTIIRDESLIREELVRNIYTHLDWYTTQEHLEKNGVTTFVEAGPGNSLKKNSRFISEETTFLTAIEYLSSLTK